VSLAEKYINGIHHELGYWATWGPATHLALGDCGPVEDGVFKREANIRDWGIEFDELPNPVTGGWSFISDKSAKITIQAKADNQSIPQVPQGRAGLSIAFEDDEAIVFAAHGGNETEIDNIHRLKLQLLERGRGEGKDAFPRGFAVVTRLVTAASTTVLVTEAAGGQFVVSGAADFKAGLVDLANATVGVSVAHAHKVRTELDASAGATPLFRGVRLKRRWWFWLETSSLEARLDDGDLPFDEDPLSEE
jgi:hypothetical protein